MHGVFPRLRSHASSPFLSLPKRPLHSPRSTVYQLLTFFPSFWAALIVTYHKAFFQPPENPGTAGHATSSRFCRWSLYLTLLLSKPLFKKKKWSAPPASKQPPLPSSSTSPGMRGGFPCHDARLTFILEGAAVGELPKDLKDWTDEHVIEWAQTSCPRVVSKLGSEAPKRQHTGRTGQGGLQGDATAEPSEQPSTTNSSGRARSIRSVSWPSADVALPTGYLGDRAGVAAAGAAGSGGAGALSYIRSFDFHI